MYSKIIAGVMTWGAWGNKFDSKKMMSLMSYFLDKGISTFDHADIYGGYTTEEEFGIAFSKSNISRNAIQLISKCGIKYVCENRPEKIKHYDYSTEYIIWSVENSLRNLKTDYLDLLLLHRPSPLMQTDEINEAIFKLKKEGKILDFGLSNFSSASTQLIHQKTPVSVNQIQFSLTHHDAMHNGVLDYMTTNNILPMAWNPLGTYFKETNAQNSRITAVLKELTQKYNATEDQLLLSWIVKHPANIHPVIGTTNLKRIDNAIAALAIDLKLEDWFSMLVASQGHKVP